MTNEKETTILDFDFGFTAVDADELEVVQQAKLKLLQQKRKLKYWKISLIIYITLYCHCYLI